MSVEYFGWLCLGHLLPIVCRFDSKVHGFAVSQVLVNVAAGVSCKFFCEEDQHKSIDRIFPVGERVDLLPSEYVNRVVVTGDAIVESQGEDVEIARTMSKVMMVDKRLCRSSDNLTELIQSLMT